LGGGAEGGAHARHAGALAQGEGGGDVLDGVDGGARGVSHAAPRVGGQGLDVPAGALRVEDAEGEGGLAGTRHTRDGDELTQGDVDVDVLEIVDAGATDGDVVGL